MLCVLVLFFNYVSYLGEKMSLSEMDRINNHKHYISYKTNSVTTIEKTFFDTQKTRGENLTPEKPIAQSPLKVKWIVHKCHIVAKPQTLTSP